MAETGHVVIHNDVERDRFEVRKDSKSEKLVMAKRDDSEDMCSRIVADGKFGFHRCLRTLEIIC